MKINPKQLEKMARKMGMQMSQIQANEVIIRTPEKDIVISNPNVAKINMMGQETWQITGEASEKSAQPFTEADVQLVMDKTGSSKQEAEAALAETRGDLAATILKLKKK